MQAKKHLEWASFCIPSSSQPHAYNVPFLLQDLKEKINIDEERRVELEERLKCLQAQREHAEQECSRLQGKSYLDLLKFDNYDGVWTWSCIGAIFLFACVLFLKHYP